MILRMHMFMRFLHVMHFFVGMANQRINAVVTGIRQNRGKCLQGQSHSQQTG